MPVRQMLVALVALVALALAGAPHASADDGKKRRVRFATFNASLNRDAEGRLVADLSRPGNDQADAVAEIIQRVRPDILLVNEFDYDARGEAARLFERNYLGRPHRGAKAIDYRHRYVAPSNTGIPSGFDLDNNGSVGGPNDALGFGAFPGQFGMAIFSRHPIERGAIRTFQRFLWKDMPGALLPDRASTPQPRDWYSPEELRIFRFRRRATGTCRYGSAATPSTSSRAIPRRPSSMDPKIATGVETTTRSVSSPTTSRPGARATSTTTRVAAGGSHPRRRS